MVINAHVRPQHPKFRHFGSGSMLSITCIGLLGWVSTQHDLIPEWRDLFNGPKPAHWVTEVFVAIGGTQGTGCYHTVLGGEHWPKSTQ